MKILRNYWKEYDSSLEIEPKKKKGIVYKYISIKLIILLFNFNVFDLIKSIFYHLIIN